MLKSAGVDDGNTLQQSKRSKEAGMKTRGRLLFVPVILVVLTLSFPSGSARAEVNLNINIGAPPVVVAEPANVALIPGSGVYFVVDAGPDLFFHAGFWWSPRGDRWYRAEMYNGPWVVVKQRIVPVQVVRVPRDYRFRYKKAKHVPYGQWKKTHYEKARHKKSGDNGRHGGNNGHYKNQKTSKKGN
jgi:hypothetical protein